MQDMEKRVSVLKIYCIQKNSAIIENFRFFQKLIGNKVICVMPVIVYLSLLSSHPLTQRLSDYSITDKVLPGCHVKGSTKHIYRPFILIYIF